MATLTDSFAFQNPGAALYGALRDRGVDPSHSYLGSAIKRRASLFPSLLNYSTFGPGDAESQANPMASSFAAGLLGQGQNPMDPNNVNALVSRFTDAGQGTEAYSVLHSDDPAKDYSAFQDMRNFQLANANPLYAGARRSLDENVFTNLMADIAQNRAGPNVQFLETVLGRPQPPGPVAGGGDQTVRGPGFGTEPTPGAPAPPARQPAPAPAPSPAPPGGGGAPAGPINSLQALLDRFRSDQRNWGTEGFRPGAPVDIQLGNERFRYDPTQDKVRDWQGMSGTGRTTHRGNFLGQMLYYLQLLSNQRAGAGNQALGITRQTSDADILRLAGQRMGTKAVGPTGWNYARTG